MHNQSYNSTQQPQRARVAITAELVQESPIPRGDQFSSDHNLTAPQKAQKRWLADTLAPHLGQLQTSMLAASCSSCEDDDGSGWFWWPGCCKRF
mmetsp:Transcript_62586/g.164079  ORF Transcript_62586/g.164079 Transcript_62586/m.164079 type:complete len:94 (-) Transcript_62586:1175-1456(-)